MNIGCVRDWKQLITGEWESLESSQQLPGTRGPTSPPSEGPWLCRAQSWVDFSSYPGSVTVVDEMVIQ